MNELDEVTGPISEEGRDVNVIQKQIPAKTGAGTIVFIVILFLLGIIPGLIFLAMYRQAQNYLQRLQQKIQANASTIDNYLEQRVQILKNAAKLLDKSIELDEKVRTDVAKFRSGSVVSDEERNKVAGQLDSLGNKVNIAFEAYPDLKAHNEIADCRQQNSYLQREITAARELYNDSVLQWNGDIRQWPVKKFVASRHGYTTRIPFTASKETKEAARGTFF